MFRGFEINSRQHNCQLSTLSTGHEIYYSKDIIYLRNVYNYEFEIK